MNLPFVAVSLHCIGVLTLEPLKPVPNPQLMSRYQSLANDHRWPGLASVVAEGHSKEEYLITK